MRPDDEPIDYEHLSRHGTGSYDLAAETKLLVYPFGKYEITVRLTSDDRFLDVVEVRINKEFLSHRQRSMPETFHDVEEFYPE